MTSTGQRLLDEINEELRVRFPLNVQPPLAGPYIETLLDEVGMVIEELVARVESLEERMRTAEEYKLADRIYSELTP